MTAFASHRPVIVQLARPRGMDLAWKLFLAVAGSLALWVSAKIHIPFYPVPMTLQTMVVLMIGMAFGSRLGAATVLLYLVEGALGLPVFSGTPERGIGLAYMAGPTGGYLAGFLVAAGLAGWLAERGLGRGIASTALCMLLGIVVIYGAGLLWLATLVGWDQRVLALGLFPFLGAELLKLSLASCLMPALWMLVRRRAAPRQGGGHE